MLFLPAAALCCLCSALVAMAADLIQDDLTLTKKAGETVSFSCGGTNQCDRDNVYWLQKKDTETFTVILHIDKSNCKIDKGYNHPQRDDFLAVKKPKGCELKIQKVQLSHSATYYCACYKTADDYLIFGSGTKLFVTDKQVVKPVVSVYPAASRTHLEGKSSLLCLASAMSPPLVQFSWKRQNKNGRLEDLPPAEGEQLELREQKHTASILLLHQQEKSTYKYRCYVKHEGGTVRAQTEQDISTLHSPTSASTAAPPATPTPAPSADPPADPPAAPPAALVPSQYQVKLLCVLYTVLIVKSLVYCCGLSLLMILRNKGPSTNCTHAD
ncbi:immunoglobulin lambda-1 light chain-like [Thunnus albacares]|uniref:immunoglobulin lambda-1 light chain-like n=1 Tax=Thunnus albacares TaxID=8236 RepID=UPI001CF63828|nr:immunoglobulin lambda-1 light chain-like [Thunnus albacares]